MVKIISVFLVVTQLNLGSMYYDITFNYDSLLVGLHKPYNCTLTDEEWRAFYTSRFPESFSEVNISSRAYDWYRTQLNTNDPEHNCGPACVSMALKWYDEDYNKSVNEIRGYFGSYYRGISTDEMGYYLRKFSVPITVGSIDLQKLKDVISGKGIVIIIYKTRTNYHSVVVNGYYIFDGKTYITYYDPEGNNKHYDANDIDMDYYMRNYRYNIISWEELSIKIYSNWSISILPKTA